MGVAWVVACALDGGCGFSCGLLLPHRYGCTSTSTSTSTGTSTSTSTSTGTGTGTGTGHASGSGRSACAGACVRAVRGATTTTAAAATAGAHGLGPPPSATTRRAPRRGGAAPCGRPAAGTGATAAASSPGPAWCVPPCSGEAGHEAADARAAESPCGRATAATAAAAGTPPAPARRRSKRGALRGCACGRMLGRTHVLRTECALLCACACMVVAAWLCVAA